MGKRKLIFGVGINDAEYPVAVGGRGAKIAYDPIYKVWFHMLRRCYSKAQQVRQVTYIGCTVAHEWLTFSNFRDWMVRQPWQGRQIDKDILFPGNKVYSPEACVFVTQQTNLLLVDRGNDRGDYPLGVTYDKGRGLFQGKVSKDARTVGLGRFSNPMDAHAAWQREKAKIIRTVAAQQDDWRVEIALLARADQLDNDRLLGMETIKL